MQKIISVPGIFLLIFLSYGVNSAQLKIVDAFPNLPNITKIVDIQNSGDGTNRLFIVSQLGTIYVMNNDSLTSEIQIFLDLSEKIVTGGEMGLLGLTFHPGYENNGYFYVDYTAPLGNIRKTVLSRFRADPNDQNKADINSELVLLEVEQPYPNHNGGQLAFGPDGFLYLSLGDGGNTGDPHENGQNRTNLLGTIIRINIDEPSTGKNYSIPPDNPFAGNTTGFREEIYAYGFRNPWRFSFDHETNRLITGDVGQSTIEEIDIVEKGGNYGWRILEGSLCFKPLLDCDRTGLTLPIWEYFHDDNGGYSITGGYIYRGSNASEISGRYIYADYVSNNIWALEIKDNSVNNELLFNYSVNIATFGIDEQKELYFGSHTNGRIYKFSGTPVSSVDSEVPSQFMLEQNYPNPFNPMTTIRYQIPNLRKMPIGNPATSMQYGHPAKLVRRTCDDLYKTYSNQNSVGHHMSLRQSNVKLCIYDILGREIQTLVNEFQNPGTYEIQFDASNLTSGIYFYRLNYGPFGETKKMIFLK